MGSEMLQSTRSYKDTSIIMGNESITQRYLTRNVFNGSKLAPKESIRESLERSRHIQYSQILQHDMEQEAIKLNKFVEGEELKLQNEIKSYQDKVDLVKKVIQKEERQTEQIEK